MSPNENVILNDHFCKPCQASHPWISNVMQVDGLLMRYVESQASGEFYFFNIVVRRKQPAIVKYENNPVEKGTGDTPSVSIFVEKENPNMGHIGDINTEGNDWIASSSDSEAFSVENDKLESFTIDVSNLMKL